MNKQKFVRAVSAGLAKRTRRRVPLTTLSLVIDEVWDQIENIVKAGDTYRALGFATFGSKYKPARTGIHPRTRELVTFAHRRKPIVKFSSQLVLSPDILPFDYKPKGEQPELPEAA